MDVWTVTALERSKHDQQFSGLAPVNGVITGDQAKGFLVQSQLPMAVLGKIWALADYNADGNMDANEFSIACKLITMKLQGHQVPETLPMSLKNSVFGQSGISNGAPASLMSQPMSAVPIMPQTVPAVPMMPQTVPVVPMMPQTVPAAAMISQPLAPLTAGVAAALPSVPSHPPAAVGQSPAAMPRSPSIGSPHDSSPGVVSGEWAVPQASRLRFTQLFNQHDRTKSGYLSGPQARNILMQSALPNNVLAQIWALSDVDSDGRLSCEEFILCMHLCDITRQGGKLPNSLPPDLLPPAYRRARAASVNSIGSAPGEPTSADAALTSPTSQFSFEDKRRENYNKGQAELERRRKILEDQHKREQDERQRKERELLEKQERFRLEQEQRRQDELERQVQVQLEMEQQQEEARIREQEQREAARREMERQRKDEWENSKRQELDALRQKQQEQVLKLKAQNTQLTVQLETATDRVKGLTKSISETRGSVTEVKSVIDGMRSTRDTSMAELTSLKSRLRQQNNRLLQANQERAVLETSCKQNAVDSEGGVGLDSKQHLLEQLAERAREAETRCDEKEVEVESSRLQFDTIRQQMDSLLSQCRDTHAELSNKQRMVRQLRTENPLSAAGPPAVAAAPTVVSGGWTADFESGGGDAAPWTSQWGDPGAPRQTSVQSVTSPVTDDPWAASNTPAAVSRTAAGGGKVPHRALYEFHGRSNDEISFQPNDIIMINLDAHPEASWLEGEINGHVGWLPESYVEPIDPVAADVGAGDMPELKSEAVSAVPDAVPDTVQTNGVTSEEDAAGWYLAVYPYSSAEADDLNFQQGDLIQVTAKHGEWWTGTLNGVAGMFPSNYVQPAESADTAAVAADTTAPATDAAAVETAGDVDDQLQHQQTAPQSGTEDCTDKPVRLVRAPTIKKRKGEVAVVLASYEATSAEQLTLVRGQLVMVRKKSATGWWEGEIQMRGRQRQVGWFPASFVKLKTSRRMSLPDETDPAMPEAQCPGDAPSPDPTAPKEVAVAQFPYTAQHDDELSFDTDDVITIVNKDDIAWWKGEFNGVTGLFPSNYVLPKPTQCAGSKNGFNGSGNGYSGDRYGYSGGGYGNSGGESLYRGGGDRYDGGDGYSGSGSGNSGGGEGCSGAGDRYDDGDRYSAGGGYNAGDVYSAGDGYNTGDGYRNGEGGDGRRVAGSGEEEDRCAAAHDDSVGSSEWSADETADVRERTNSDDRERTYSDGYRQQDGMDDTHESQLTTAERQRQTAITELLQSEESYLHSISIVNEVFRRPLVSSGLLTRQECRLLFVNLHELVICSRKLVMALRVRRKMSHGGVIQRVGDIMCENLPNMQCYLRFCSCQLRSAGLLQAKVQLPAFDEAVRRCQSHPRAAGLPLSSFLLQPMQRITKYPLLLKQVLKHTDPGHPDWQNMEEAVNKAEELCRQMNGAVGEQENSDRLEWLQDRVDLGDMNEKLVFNSMTNLAGPRKLIHYGLLRKTKSGRELVAFLFNDFLLLTTASKVLGSVNQSDLERSLSDAKLKLYRKPMFLEGLSVSVCDESPSDSWTVSCSEQRLMVSCSSTVARDLWVKRVRSALDTSIQMKRDRLERENSLESRFIACGRLLVVVMSANRLIAAGENVIINATARCAITVLRAVQLEARDANGKSDPYCELTMARQVQRTPVLESTLNPRWNHSMQFLVQDVQQDVLCVSVFDRDYFSPNEFLGRTELRLADVLKESTGRGPVVKRLQLHEVKRGEVDLKLDLVLFNRD